MLQASDISSADATNTTADALMKTSARNDH